MVEAEQSFRGSISELGANEQVSVQYMKNIPDNEIEKRFKVSMVG